MELREPVVAYGKQKFTIEEYLAIEEAAIHIEANTFLPIPIFLLFAANRKRLIMTTGIFKAGSNC